MSRAYPQPGRACQSEALGTVLVSDQTGRTAPLSAAELSPHRNAMTPAMRSGGTSLWCSDAGIGARLAGVSIRLGTITLQRTPACAPSAATDWAKAMTAALEAA